jgi:fructose-specific phosphotransferase system IIC component
MPKEIPLVRPFLELGELLDGLAGAGQHTENVESDLKGGKYVSLEFSSARASHAVTYSLAQRPALSNGNLVTLLNTEGWGDVGGKVLVSLLVTGVLGDEV